MIWQRCYLYPAVQESSDTIYSLLAGAKTIVLTTGLGGGTGTGASPVIAHIAKELGAFVLTIMSYPFGFEGRRRQQIADIGRSLLRKQVDTLKVIQNDRLFRFAPAHPPIEEMYSLAARCLAWQVLTHWCEHIFPYSQLSCISVIRAAAACST
jgi:cell division protein FtsZ